MKAGLLNNNILVLKRVIITSDFGENDTNYIADYSTKANVKCESLSRTIENNEIFYSTIVNFTVRHYVPVTQWDRIMWQGKQYRILSLIPNKKTQELKIITEMVNE